MNKKQLLDLIAKKEARKNNVNKRTDEIINNENPSADDVKELRSINQEIRDLDSEIASLRSLADSMSDDDTTQQRSNEKPPLAEGEQIIDGDKRSYQPQGKLNILGTYSTGTRVGEQQNNYEELKAKYEQRGQDLKDKKKVTYDIRSEMPLARSITLASSNLVVPTQYSNTLNETFNEVSSLVDLVHAVPMMGGETYEKGFKKPATASADYTDEGKQYKTTDSVWDKVTISKSYITDYAEISKQAIKLPNVDYQAQVGGDLRKNLRKKLSREIMVGDGTAGHLTGIFNAPANVIPADSDISIAEIDKDTLDTIVFGFGGDEDVEGGAYLILNKNDLAAFSKIRATDGKKLYKITLKGNTGTISSDDSFAVNFVINSNCPAISDSKTTAGTYCIAYGFTQNYELPIFSDVDVEMSTDYKFGEGMVAFAGDTYAGGNVAAWKGFLRIKKAAAAGA